MTSALASLNPAAEVALISCEQRIERGLKTFIDVGQALAEIRDSRLYKGTHETFEDYCRERWGFSRQRAQQFTAAAELATTIVDTGLPSPTNEGQTRELGKLPESERAEVWRDAVEQTDGKPTAAAVRHAAAERSDAPKSDDLRDEVLRRLPKTEAKAATVIAMARAVGAKTEHVRETLIVMVEAGIARCLVGETNRYWLAPAETPGPVESRSTALTGPGEDPAPAVDPMPSQEPAAEPHLSLVPPVTPPAGSPATWTAEQVEANKRVAEARRMRESGRRKAATLVTTVSTEIYTVTAAVELGERGLVTADMVRELREAVEHLAKFVEAGA